MGYSNLDIEYRPTSLGILTYYELNLMFISKVNYPSERHCISNI